MRVPNEYCGMTKRVDPEQTDFARYLRHKQTDAERILWNKLRNLQLEGVKFRRQHAIGNYIVDFVSLEKRLIVEIDGGQHNEGQTRDRDEERTKRLEAKDYRVLRFWNNDVLNNTEGVAERVREALTLSSVSPSPTPLPERER